MTKWDFNGNSRIPGQGSIACGYFITLILADAGFKIPASRWAQLASESFILKMTEDVCRFSNTLVQEVMEYIGSRDDTLYIAGLDCHVGFIFKKGSVIRFVHSNYYKPGIGVMTEELDSVNPLADSQYRVIGSILEEDTLIRWLLNTRIE